MSKFMIYNVSEISSIDFSQVLEDSNRQFRNIVNHAANGSKSFVEWTSDEIPDCVINLTTKEGPYTYDEMVNLLSQSDWAPPSNI